MPKTASWGDGVRPKSDLQSYRGHSTDPCPRADQPAWPPVTFVAPARDAGGNTCLRRRSLTDDDRRRVRIWPVWGQGDTVQGARLPRPGQVRIRSCGRPGSRRFPTALCVVAKVGGARLPTRGRHRQPAREETGAWSRAHGNMARNGRQETSGPARMSRTTSTGVPDTRLAGHRRLQWGEAGGAPEPS